MLYLGIDLGTTYSLAAYVNDHGLPSLFPDFHDANEFRTPSVVHLSDDGCLVGTALEELLDDEPDLSQARFFKLDMGESKAVYQDHLSRDWWPQGLSALVLKKLLKDVEAFAETEASVRSSDRAMLRADCEAWSWLPAVTAIIARWRVPCISAKVRLRN